MTVARLGRELSSRELSEWRAYDQVIREDRIKADLSSKATHGVTERHARTPRRRSA